MKVKIAKYKNYIGPYQIADYFKPVFGEERIERFTDGKFFEKVTDIINPIFTWFDNITPDRKEYVKIDRWDAWSADHTLSLIIVPLLTEMRKNLHGAPLIDDDDVPKCLQSTEDKDFTSSMKEKGEVDKFHHKRWEYIIDKIIWSMTQIRDDTWGEQFHTGETDIIWKELDSKIDGDVMYEMKKGPNDTSKFDAKGHKKYSAEIDEGTRLFGKYYRNLWT